MRKLTMIATALLASASLALTGCGEEQPKSAKSNEAAKAAAAANSRTFTENAEPDNIVKRIKLTSNPGQVGYIALLNMAGRPIAYYGVTGKVTSSGKRLTKPWEFARTDGGQYTIDTVVDGPSDEGTYGSSDPYIYFWTTGGQYVQWSGEYFYSDQPFRLREAPLIGD